MAAKLFHVKKIVWDLDDEDDNPDLPAECIVRADPADVEADEAFLANVLSDHYDFCILDLEADRVPSRVTGKQQKRLKRLPRLDA